MFVSKVFTYQWLLLSLSNCTCSETANIFPDSLSLRQNSMRFPWQITIFYYNRHHSIRAYLIFYEDVYPCRCEQLITLATSVSYLFYAKKPCSGNNNTWIFWVELRLSLFSLIFFSTIVLDSIVFGYDNCENKCVNFFHRKFRPIFSFRNPGKSFTHR